MNMKISYIILSLFLISSCCCADNFDITELLGKYPELSSFNNYLSETNLRDEINSLKTVTVLAVDNDGMSSISGESKEMLRKIMSVHVLLNYFDVVSLRMMPGSSTLAKTLLESDGEQGFVKLTVTLGGELFFGSSAGGSGSDTGLVKAIVSKPYNISVLQIHDVIVPNGIETVVISASPGPSPAGSDESEAKAKAPASAPVGFNEGPAPAESNVAPAQDESGDDVGAPAPVESDVGAPAPVESDEEAPTPAESDLAPAQVRSYDGPGEGPAPVELSPQAQVIVPMLPPKSPKGSPPADPLIPNAPALIDDGPVPGPTNELGNGAVSVRFGGNLVVMIVPFVVTWLAFY